MAQMNSKKSGPEQHSNSNVSHPAPFFVLLCSYSKYLFTDYEKKHTTSQDPQQVLTASMGSSNNRGILSLLITVLSQMWECRVQTCWSIWGDWKI